MLIDTYTIDILITIPSTCHHVLTSALHRVARRIAAVTLGTLGTDGALLALVARWTGCALVSFLAALAPRSFPAVRAVGAWSRVL